MPQTSDTPRPQTLRLRKPRPTDGSDIWALVKRCAPLDVNSMYCNLVQAEHFRDTCVVAERDGRIVGWVSGHMIPAEDALFVWQVAVCPSARGLGLGKKMLLELLERDACDGASALKTTITADNAASWSLFRSLTRAIGGALDEAPHFESDRHFDGRHDTEHMVTIALPETGAVARAA
ncbi:2,4-diaminobutyric acid acetyltransferase [Defluviimonas sp. 20V17]|uniref:L-2,4-diaminobutyric acid acetyltransferase n=1 Tax=Allgaiera indica TaxID=765699 RepID=A0AAN4ZYY3_9RHOB|nr:diaminobutyrate acetyltransferase [Allgaiera indica]KDB02804.1 2,4-diaminobutyric acid acetyltransferase [Defluviimonas sp. 20V17]GHE01141.1 L-2,4-diaminobutyric acid acetyltransferase [Allgaiera indica]SDW81423.1 diaminobutyrate acetyltransferase [Allgaiera indica]